MLVRVPGDVTFGPFGFGTVHESAKAPAGPGVEAVTYAAAAEEWFRVFSMAFAVEPFEEIVAAQAPKEEEAGCHCCEEDEWEDEGESCADAEDDEDDCSQQPDHQTHDQGEDGHCEREHDEESQRKSGEEDVQSEKGLAK